MHAPVFSIEEFAVFDGPGIRTSAFLSGCPLRCEWCHNPEGQSYESYILRSPNGCLNCGKCKEKAVNGKFTEESILACPRRLLRYSAKDYTSDELIAKLLKNADILNRAGGGVTLSGGEPLSRIDFVLEVLKGLRGKVHRAVQTSGFCKGDDFRRVLDETEYILYDIKLVDEQLHIRYTGKSNAQILQNFEMLAASGHDFITRTPLIPDVTDTEKNIESIACLLKKNGVKKIELLPYNRSAGAKYTLAGKDYSPSFDESKKETPHTKIFDKYDIDWRIL